MGKAPIKLYAKGRLLGYKRSLTNQYTHTSVMKIEGVQDRKDTSFYVGKRVAFVYRATRRTGANPSKGKKGTKIRCIWGKVTRPHGNTGAVRAKFSTNLPPKTIGATVRVMMYPSAI